MLPIPTSLAAGKKPRELVGLTTPTLILPKSPKGPFRTKNVMALKIVVLYYRHRFSQSVQGRIDQLFLPGSPNYNQGSELHLLSQ